MNRCGSRSRRICSPRLPIAEWWSLQWTQLLQIFRRLSKQEGIHITPHALRRAFIILSLRAGMDVLYLQAMLGHASVDMVQLYAQMVDDDLIQSHQAFSPIEDLMRL